MLNFSSSRLVSLDSPVLNQHLTVQGKSILARDAIHAILQGLSNQVSSDSYEVSWGEKNSYKNIDIRVELKPEDEIDLAILAGKVGSVIETAFSSVLEIDSSNVFDDLSPLDTNDCTLCKCSLRSAEKQGPSLTISVDSIEGKKMYVLDEMRRLVSNPTRKGVLQVPELTTLMLRVFSGDLGVVSSFFHQIEQLVFSLPILEEKTKVACGSMKRLFLFYKDRLDQIPSHLWDQLRTVASLSIAPESKGKPWKDLFMSLFKDFQGVPNNEVRMFLDTVFHLLPQSSGLLENEQEKWIYNLQALVHLDTPPKLARNQSPSLLEVLKNAGIPERREWIRKCFEGRGIEDPFNFRNNLRFLLTSQERTQMVDSDTSAEFLRLAWNLVHCQRDLVGFPSMLSDCQEVFYSHGSQEARKQYVEFLKKIFLEEQNESLLLQTAMKSYVYLSSHQELADFVEEMFFLGETKALAVQNFAQENRELSTAFYLAFSRRIADKLKEGVGTLRPPFMCLLIRNLFALSNDRSDTVMHLSGLLQACNEDPKKINRAVSEIQKFFPEFWGEILEGIKGTSCEKNVIMILSEMRQSLSTPIQRQCFTQLMNFLDADINVENGLMSFFDAITDKEKTLIIRKYAELRANRHYVKTSVNLLVRTVQSISSWTKVFQELGKTTFLLEQYFDLFQKAEVLSQDQVEAIFAKIPKKEFFVPPTAVFMEKLLPHLSEKSREMYFEENKTQIAEMIASKRSMQEILSRMYFVLKDGIVSGHFQRETLGRVGAFYISCFTERLEKIYPLFMKNHRDASLLVSYIEKYLSFIATDKERADLVYKCATCRCNFMHKALQGLADLSFLKDYPWSDQELEEGFLLLRSEPKSAQRYVEFALENLKNPRMSVLKKMAPFLTVHSKDKMIAEMLKWSHKLPAEVNKKLWLEDYLSTLITMEPYFSENPLLYSAFLDASYMYMSLTGDFEQEREMFEKIEEIIVKDLDSGEESPEKEKILQKLIIFAGITAFPRRPEFAISVIKSCSPTLLTFFSKEIRSWSARNRTLFFQGLLARLEERGKEEILFKVWKDQFLSLQRASPKELQEMEAVFIRWSKAILTLEPPFSQTISDAVSSLRKIFLKSSFLSSGEELAFKLLKHVHCSRLKGEPSQNTPIDRMAYLEFLRDVEIDQGKGLEAYIKEKGLFLGNGDLRRIVRLYDEVRFQELHIQEMYNKKNIVRDLEVLDKIDKNIPETSPEGILLSTYLGIRMGKHGMEEIFNVYNKLISGFSRDTLRVTRVFQEFYHFAWADFRLLCEKNDALMQFFEPIIRLTNQLLLESMEEYKEVQDVNEERLKILMRFFYSLYAIYTTGFFDENSFYTRSLGRGDPSFKPEGYLVDLALKLSENERSFFDHLLAYANIEKGELEDDALALDVSINYKSRRLKFFTELLKKLPVHRNDLRSLMEDHVRKLSLDFIRPRK